MCFKSDIIIAFFYSQATTGASTIASTFFQRKQRRTLIGGFFPRGTLFEQVDHNLIKELISMYFMGRRIYSSPKCGIRFLRVLCQCHFIIWYARYLSVQKFASRLLSKNLMESAHMLYIAQICTYILCTYNTYMYYRWANAIDWQE